MASASFLGFHRRRGGVTHRRSTGATINTAGGTVTVGVGGTLSGAGTIQGNVNNVAGTVSPGASPGMLTITGNYTQGASGVLDMQIGGLVAGTDYDQLRVGGTTSLAGTLNTALINGFVPPTGSTFTLVQSTGAVSGTFTTTNQPVGTLLAMVNAVAVQAALSRLLTLIV